MTRKPDCRLANDLRRCDEEIAAMQGQTEAPAWLVTVGVMDWQIEKRLILAACARAEGCEG